MHKIVATINMQHSINCQKEYGAEQQKKAGKMTENERIVFFLFVLNAILCFVYLSH